jgi:hypothetical protein
VNDQPGPSTPVTVPARPRSGGMRATVPVIVISIALLGSIAYILWVVREVQDGQIPLLSYGFAALGLCFGAIAIGCVVGMWRSASRAEGGRSFGLALVGGLAGLAAIGSFSVMALLMLVWNS